VQRPAMPQTQLRRLPKSHPIGGPKSLEGFWHTSKPQSTPAPVPVITPAPPVSRVAQPQPSAIARQPASQAAPKPSYAPSEVLQQQETPVKKRRFAWLAMPMLAIVGMGAGFLLQSLLIGQVMLLLYAVWAFWRRVPSKTTFLMGLMTFGTTVLFFTVRQNGQLAQNFAVYTFWIVVIGTISMAIEIRESQRASRRQAQR